MAVCMSGIGFVRVNRECAYDSLIAFLAFCRHDNSIGRYNMPTHT